MGYIPSRVVVAEAEVPIPPGMTSCAASEKTTTRHERINREFRSTFSFSHQLLCSTSKASLNQKTTVAAMQMAEKRVREQRS